MEDNQGQPAKLSLHDISQALAGASDEELIEFAAVRECRVDGPYRAVGAWDYLSHERQRAILKGIPWVAALLSLEQKDRFAQGLDGAKYIKRPTLEPAPATEPQKAPWWQFWK